MLRILIAVLLIAGSVNFVEAQCSSGVCAKPGRPAVLLRAKPVRERVIRPVFVRGTRLASLRLR